MSRSGLCVTLLVLLLILLFSTTPALTQACPDADLDGFADCLVPGCDPTGLTCGDCDDSRDDVYLGATEVCDQVDNDCDGYADEDFLAHACSLRVLDPAGMPQTYFGIAVAPVGDVNGDGTPDFVVGVERSNHAASGGGMVVLFDGATRTVICRALDPAAAHNDYLGSSVAGVDDIDGDGTYDFVAGSRLDDDIASASGSASVFSGADCSAIMKLTDSAGAYNDQLGTSVAGLGDITGDGTPDIAVGAPYFDNALGSNAGYVVVFSGADGSVHLRLEDPGGSGAEELGRSVAPAGDVDNDGTTDIVVGAPRDDNSGTDSGSASVFSGADGSQLLFLLDPLGGNYDQLGGSVTGIGDLDHDGTDDVAAGAHHYDTGYGNNSGTVIAFSGADGSVIQRFEDPGATGSEELGLSIGPYWDEDQDGTYDLIAGARRDDGSGVTEGGTVILFSGGDASIIEKFFADDPQENELLGHSVAPAGDVTGDNEPEILTGAYGWTSVDGANTGSAHIFSRASDCDLDGFSPHGGDCDDGDSGVYPGADELCNSVDDDCDGSIDEDGDGDGYGPCEGDLDDRDPLVSPGAEELCNGADDDYDGSIDEGPDVDLDGYDAPCDCDDSRDDIHAGATEICDGLDNDCDGEVDEGAATETSSLDILDRESASRDSFGFALAVLGDVNGDGTPDFVVGNPGDDGDARDIGSAVLLSGADRSEICRARASDASSSDSLGRSACAAGDLDGDGTTDFAVGAPYEDGANADTGSVYVFSGADCSELFKLYDPAGAYGDNVGVSVAGPGDVDGDGTPDIAAGAYRADTQAPNGGAVYLFSGSDGSVIYIATDPQALNSDQLGWSLASIGDVDWDGVNDLAAGVYTDDTLSGGDSGSIVVFSGATGERLYKAYDPDGSAYDNLGHSVAGLVDIDGDHVPDFISGAYLDDTIGNNAGAVIIFSGADGAPIRRLTDPMGSATDRLGHSVSVMPDMSGDGYPEVVAGAPGNDQVATDSGRVVVFSPMDGSVLRRFIDPVGSEDEELGSALAAISDLSGGGHAEILAGASSFVTDEGADTGKVVVFSYEGDCDNDGLTPLNDCDDSDNAIGPFGVEVCNAADDDCDGSTDEDGDGDGYDPCTGDCDDANPDAYPGALETCNSIDDDCDGSIDEGPDADSDTFHAPCDCDDVRSDIYPGAIELCDGVDNDCDGEIDEGATPPGHFESTVNSAGTQGDQLGHSLALVGDVDGDSVPDFVVGVPSSDEALVNAGAVRLYSGATRTLLCTATGGSPTGGDELGSGVAGVGDINGDGTPDFAAGAEGNDVQAGSAGAIEIFSGANCSSLMLMSDPDGMSTDRLGTRVVGLGDVNNDGTPDVAGAATRDDAMGTDAGAVIVFSGADGSKLYEAKDPGGAQADYLGRALAAIGDVNLDGVPDFAAGAHADDAFGGTNCGSVVVFSGKDGSKLYKATDPDGAAYDDLGYSVAGIGDCDGDHVPDILVGAANADTAAGNNAGAILIFSGADGSRIIKMIDDLGAAGDELGYAVASMEDITGDGVPEVLAGKPNGDTAATNAGELLIFSGSNGIHLHRLSVTGSDPDVELGQAVLAPGELSGYGKPEVIAGAPLHDIATANNVGSFTVFSLDADCDSDGYTVFTGDCDDNEFSAHPGGVEICDDVDNDCNDLVDDGMADIPETCDGVDENCNGLIDEGDPGGGAACSTGLPGVCDPGIIHCDGGSTVCVGDVGPGPEECNTLDDDCDGTVDEAMDSDGDGYDDCNDNCLDAHNPSQANADGDQWGDACDCTPGDNSNPPPPPVGNTLFLTKEGDGSTRLDWSATPEGDTYNCYRGWRIVGDAFAYNHQCMDNRGSDTTANDPVDPRKGVAFFYLVTAYCGSNSESTCGQDSDLVDRPTPDACPAATLDDDGDGWEEAQDNCPGFRNSSQSDVDSDSRGDACDNCPDTANTDQADLDNDGLGDVCDPDQDGDGILDDGDGSGTPGDAPCTGGTVFNCDDNCPRVDNPLQEDTNNNGIGDACEGT